MGHRPLSRPFASSVCSSFNNGRNGALQYPPASCHFRTHALQQTAPYPITLWAHASNVGGTSRAERYCASRHAESRQYSQRCNRVAVHIRRGGSLGSSTFRALSAPVTGRPVGLSNPICTSTPA
jgi:hypothetical protein